MRHKFVAITVLALGLIGLGPRLGAGQVAPDQLVVLPALPEEVAEDHPVVFVVGRVAGVEEAARVRQPRHGRGAGVRDRVRQLATGLDVDDPQDASLVTAGRLAEGDERAVARRVVPVDGGGVVTGDPGRIEEGAPDIGRIGGDAHDQAELWEARTTLEAEDVPTRHPC